MDKMKMDLIAKALRRYEKIYPCGTKSSFGECFTFHENQILFWFDTEDKSTHLLAQNAMPAMADCV